MAEINSQFNFDENQEMETQPIYLSSDESEIDSLCSSPIPQLPNNVPDTYSAITQLIAAQHEQMSLSGTSAPQYPITPSTSLISDDENDDMLPPITSNPAQFLPYTPNRHPISIQLCQQITPIPDTPESPTPENRGQPDIFRPYDIPNEPSSTILNNPPIPIIKTVTDGLQNLTLHPHPQRNEWATGCLVTENPMTNSSKKRSPIISINQHSQGRQYENAKSKQTLSLTVFRAESSLFSPPGVSQAAACDGLLYSVNFNGQNAGTQAYALPLFED